MKKSIIIILGVMLLTLTIAAGVVAYLYTQSGNNHIKKYVEKKIQHQTGMPIKLNKFRLTKGHLYFVAVLGTEASLGFDGKFNILKRSLNGRYLLKAYNAKYDKYTLRQANIAGHVGGTIDNLKLDGNGTLLDAPTVYKLKIEKSKPKDIIVQMRKLPLDELLALSGNAKIIRGKLDADLIIPSLGKKGSTGHVIAKLKNASFDSELIKKLYNYELPANKKSLKGALNAKFDGDKVTFAGDIFSDLITVNISNGQGNIGEKRGACDVSIDTVELSPVTQNRLHGPLKLSGVFQYDHLGAHIRAKTNSFGGSMELDYTKSVSATLSNVLLSKLLLFSGQPSYAEGKLNGKLILESPQARNGNYNLKLKSGKLHTKVINEKLDMQLPESATLSLNSTGSFVDGALSAKTNLKSNLFDLVFSDTIYTIADKKLETKYAASIPNPLALAGKKGKGIPVSVTGTILNDDIFHIKGFAKGLGKKLTFDYSGTHLKIDGDDVEVSKVLASMGKPMAFSGFMDVHVDLKKLNPLAGKLSLVVPRLKTYPMAMKKLVGKSLKTTMNLSVTGRAKMGIMYLKSDIDSKLLTLALSKITIDTNSNFASGPFNLKVPDMGKLHTLTGAKLKGPFETKGRFEVGKDIKITGSSSSLGGKMTYRYEDTLLYSKMVSVPLPKLLHLLNQPEQMLGTVNANIQYDTKDRTGTTHLTALKFQFKPSKLTTAVKMVLQKDLANVIYDRTVADATFNGDDIAYNVVANGKHSVFGITDGLMNTKAKTNRSKFTLSIDDLDVMGTISGPVKDPKVKVLPGKMIQNKLKQKLKNKLDKKVLTKAKSIIKKDKSGVVNKIMKKIPFF